MLSLIPAFALVAALHADISFEILSTAKEKGIPENVFMGIAICESGLNSRALNPKDTDGIPAKGLMQFKDKTFSKFGGNNIWDWNEQIEVAGRMMKNDLYGHWPTCIAETLRKINEVELLN